VNIIFSSSGIFNPSNTIRNIRV